MITSRTIKVQWSTDGFHRWPGASPERVYLADRHRHRFVFSVTIPVSHSERDVEFHDLLETARANIEAGGTPVEFGAKSCESIAEELAAKLGTDHGLDWVVVSVSEDGYVEGCVRWENDV